MGGVIFSQGFRSLLLCLCFLNLASASAATEAPASAALAATTSPEAADNPNSVVQIDFSRQFEAIEIPKCARQQIVHVTLADRNVACLLPQRSSSGLQMLDRLQQFLTNSPDEDPENALLAADSAEQETEKCTLPTRISKELHVGSPELQSYLRAARLRWLLDRCFRFSDVGVRDWRYELCIGRKITLFKSNALSGKTIGKSLFELGTYASSMDQLWADGTMTQWYTGGTDGRQTEVRFVCGDTHPRVKGISGPHGGKYRVWLEAPMFCDYRENAPDPPLTESLIRSLEGWCSTFTTDGWWSYEYCHPDSLVEFHKEPNGDITGPKHLLGTLHASGDAAEMIFKRPNPANPTLRGTDTLPPKMNGSPRFKFLPVEIVERPKQFSKNPVPASNKVLALQLTNGTICEGTDIQRSTRVLFECPVDFPILGTHRIVHIEETSFCTYELLIQTPLVCPHPQLLPPRPLDAQPVLGYPEGASVIHNPVPASWRGLEVKQDNKEYTKKNKTNANPLANVRLEAVPQEMAEMFKDGATPYFGLSSDVRRRISVVEPQFKIGDIVRHRWWLYTAVVLSWDFSCRAPEEWLSRVYAVYPESLKSTPHYLVLLHSPKDRANANEWPLYAYVPEAVLELTPSDVSEFVHPAISSYFEPLKGNRRHFDVLSDSLLATRFPADLGL
ncbi:ubiquitin carboxyl-terminal hydrolase, putative [Eimeria mitis]|uniref:Ubiquitin carboxyl-terminal hydrolase, putative n=1 Tax=Eimeria mitis TaxID=44415 RepID=U6KC39_9EIME|nr:ubiquitin carboxyl-terminal hydrolase, putative [Eimeria mitis]CDJ34336.1 ubiquitin carboxyl-terminal hydrolase, putative [Eimeria mitis]